MSLQDSVELPNRKAMLLHVGQLMASLGSELPVNPEKMADANGVHVREVSFEDGGVVQAVMDELDCCFEDLEEVGLTKDFLRDKRGLAWSKGGKACVFIRAGLDPVTRRWVCAHELAHHLLGHVDGAACAVGDRYRAREGSANWLAAQILVPQQWISLAVAELGCWREGLARLFGVRQCDISARLAELGLTQRKMPDAPRGGSWVEFSIYDW